MGTRLRAFILVAAASAAPASGQWTEGPGGGWVQASLYHHQTSSRFNEIGQRTDLFNEGGRSTATSLFLTGVVGLRRGLDAWVQIPIHRLEFTDVVEDRLSTGVGDPRLQLRIGHQMTGLDMGRWALALRGGVKFKGSDFPVDSEIIPLTEGQTDVEAVLEIGRSIWPRPVYAMAWIGYRWRSTNRQIDKKPGNERFGLVAVGGVRSGWTWKVTVEIQDGVGSDFFGLRIPSSRRDLGQLLFAVGREIGRGAFEVGIRQPMWGRNLPAGSALFLGYFTRYGG